MLQKQYSAEFKHGTVEQTRQAGVRCAQVVRELGIAANLLTRWRREADPAGITTFSGTGRPRDQERSQLKRAVARIKQERDL